MAETRGVAEFTKNRDNYLVVKSPEGYTVFLRVSDKDYNYTKSIDPLVANEYGGQKYITLGLYDSSQQNRFRAVSDSDSKLFKSPDKAEAFRSAFNSKILTIINTPIKEIEKQNFQTVPLNPSSTPTPPPTTQTPQTPQPGQEATESPIPKAEELTKDQIESFTQLIEDNPPEWESTIDFLKKQYPDQFGSVEPYTKEEKDKFSAEEFVAWQQRQEEWKRRKKPDVDPASETTGNSVILADPCKNNFFAQVESFLQNFFKKITKAGNFVLNLPGEIKSVVDLIGTASKQFIGQIMNTVTKALVKWINGGLAGIAQKIFNAISNPIEALAKVIGVQSEILNFSKKLFDAIKCLVAKISDALVGMIEDMIVSMVKNVLNVPVCAVQEFIGALTSKITGLIDSFIGPLLGPISKIIGVVFNLRDAILKGINTIRKIANLFKCGEKKKCPTTYKYVIDKGVQKDKDNTQQKDLLDKALDYSLSEGAGNLIGDFQRQYGKWSIFGETVGDSGSELPPCNTGNIFKCGAPKVEFFGGGGAGASGQVILGNFINKIDKDDI